MFRRIADSENPPSGLQILSTRGWDAERIVSLRTLGQFVGERVATIYEIVALTLAIFEGYAELRQPAKTDDGDEDIHGTADRMEKNAKDLRDAQMLKS